MTSITTITLIKIKTSFIVLVSELTEIREKINTKLAQYLALENLISD